jgi:hypothetical protein
MGLAEDPGEMVEKTFDVMDFSQLTVRGEITLEIRQGDRTTLRVRTTRALFDQLSVFSLFGWANVAVETGLRGPREEGPVNLWVTLPRLDSLTVLGNSSAAVDWPQSAGLLFVKDGSSVDLSFSGDKLVLEGTLHARLTVTGQTSSLSVRLRNASELNATTLRTGKATLELDEGSSAKLGITREWSGELRHGSQASTQGEPPTGKLTGQ